MNRLFVIVSLVIIGLVTGLLFSLPTPAGTQASTPASAATGGVLIENVYVTNRDGERTTQSLLLRNGMIERIHSDIAATSDMQVIDGASLTAIPALIDSHTHSYATALGDTLRFGIATHIDMNTPASELPGARERRSSTGATKQADLFSSGTLATVAKGHGTQFGFPMETLSGPEDAVEWVRARKAEGSDFIKLVYMPYQSYYPSLDRSTTKALIDAAHAENLLAVAHISTQRAAMDVIEDGIDGLVHIFADELASDELIALAVQKQIVVIPTLAVIASVAGEDDPVAERDEVQRWLSPMQKQTLANRFTSTPPGFNMEHALENVRRLHQAGVTVLAGSDAPNPGTAYGYSLHYELELLVRAGLAPAAALRAATELPARVFGLSDRGALSEGLRADILLVQGNPYQSIRASRQIRHVIKNGYEVERVEPQLVVAPPLPQPQLSDFDSDLQGPGEWSWAATDDGMMGGESSAKIKREARSDGGFALAVYAQQKAGFPWPWAGAGLGSASQTATANVSMYSTITFDIKGTPGKYRMMLFSGAGAGEPPTRTFDVSPEWQTVRLALDEFPGFDPEAFSMLSIVAGAGPADVEFVVDEVRFEQ